MLVIRVRFYQPRSYLCCHQRSIAHATNEKTLLESLLLLLPPTRMPA